MLTDVAIRRVKPAAKPFKVYDSENLYLYVAPTGRCVWRWRYRFNRCEKLLTIGRYPTISLREAREKRDEARLSLERGIDPSRYKQQLREQAVQTFKLVALEWLERQKPTFSASTLQKATWTFEDLLFPILGNRPIAEITAPDVLAVCRRLEARGKHETAHRTKQRAGQVFRYAIATGRALRDPTADLRGALTTVRTKHHAALTTPAAVGGLLRAIDAYRGQFTTECALKLCPLLFVRPGELRAARWEEFSLASCEWRIPAERMKMREMHIVPLSTQAMEVLKSLHPVTGPEGYLFPAMGKRNRPMCENTVTVALRQMGYTGDQMTWHGFRTIASTLLNEMGVSPDLIELQLAHRERDPVRAAYNRAQRLPERRQMMQMWADYLDRLRSVAT